MMIGAEPAASTLLLSTAQATHATMHAGPGWLRFVLESVIAIVIGVQDGLRDVRSGRRPFVVSALFAGDRGSAPPQSAPTHGEADERGSARATPPVRDTLRPVGVLLLIAFLVEAFLQVFTTGHLAIGTAVGASIGCIAIPFTLSRAGTNRIASATGRGRPRS